MATSLVDKPPDLAHLAAGLETAMLSDRAALSIALRDLARGSPRRASWRRDAERLVRRIDESRTRLSRRRARVPPIRFDDELPVAAARKELSELISQHQVVVVCGETGSGKSTQLPKICLELGRGVAGMIGHTQPRRVAARAVASRVAEELGGRLGDVVGYRVRFSERLSRDTLIKVLTDGMLVAEIESDRHLTRYDTLILDEAHERSLNIDVLLGYLKQLLPRRPDLKLLVTSATIDPQGLARHFGEAPKMEIPGRVYPVEVRYRPINGNDEEERDYDALLQAVREVCSEGRGDILVFLPGEREIREAGKRLRASESATTQVLPLYARLSSAEQQRIFAAHSGRRIVLATNVAETSLTVPGVRFVIDTGLARVGRYHPGRKVQRLPVEPVSQASANQRTGRCGRTESGVCIRLYSEADFESRPPFTEPEIRRSALADVVLRLSALQLGPVQAFPFMDPPPAQQVRGAVRLLQELGALDDDRNLTATGKELARLPVDPRIGRMLIAARTGGCLTEVLALAAVLAIPDPRVVPQEQRDAARGHHRNTFAAESDFLALLRLWTAYRQRRANGSRRALRRWCQENFLSYARMQEWSDLHRQLSGLASHRGWEPNAAPATPPSIHRALLAGLIGNIAVRDDEGGYLGTHGKKLRVFPGSMLAKARPRWIMAAELIETSALYAHLVAPIDPRWVEPLAGPYVRYAYAEPHWDPRRGQAMVYEQATLYGLPIVTRRKTALDRVDPAQAREVFIRGALVDGRYRGKAACLTHNRGVRRDIAALEHKHRVRGLFADDQALFAFYDERIPAAVSTAARFERWRRRAERDNPRLLYLSQDDLLGERTIELDPSSYPDMLDVKGTALRLSYAYCPDEDSDGVTVDVPLALLSRVEASDLDRLVPGMLREKVTALLRTLPKRLRVRLQPMARTVDRILPGLCDNRRALPAALSAWLSTELGETIDASALVDSSLPIHMRMRVRVLDDRATVLGIGRDLADLQARFGELARSSLAIAPPVGLERRGCTTWVFGDLPETVTATVGGFPVPMIPALVDEGGTVGLRLFAKRDEAERHHRDGLVRLWLSGLPAQRAMLRRQLPGIDAMCLQFAPLGTCETLRQDLVAAVVERAFLVLAEGGWVRTRGEFERRLRIGAARTAATASELCELVGAALTRYTQVRRTLATTRESLPPATTADIEAQLRGLVYPGFVSATPVGELEQFPRFLDAVARRIDKAQRDPGRDAQRLLILTRHRDRYRTAVDTENAGIDPQGLQRYRWAVEALRVSLFAQELGTRAPVSDGRLDKMWAHLDRTQG